MSTSIPTAQTVTQPADQFTAGGALDFVGTWDQSDWDGGDADDTDAESDDSDVGIGWR